MEIFTSDLSNNEFPLAEKISGLSVRKSVFDLIKKENPNFKISNFLSISELNIYRQKYYEIFLKHQVGKLSKTEKVVLESLKDKSTLSDKLDDEVQKLTFGQKVADKVATFGGSWIFIILFGLFLLSWILVNVYWLANRAFDPFPFILLNLILSTIAALQAPVIMMSQNRQEEKDRERAKKDYMVNLKSELEIRMLHEKVDHVMQSQQQESLELHKEQITVLNEILSRVKK